MHRGLCRDGQELASGIGLEVAIFQGLEIVAPVVTVTFVRFQRRATDDADPAPSARSRLALCAAMRFPATDGDPGGFAQDHSLGDLDLVPAVAGDAHTTVVAPRSAVVQTPPVVISTVTARARGRMRKYPPYFFDSPYPIVPAQSCVRDR